VRADLLGSEIVRLAERALKSAEEVNLDSLSIHTATAFVAGQWPLLLGAALPV